MIVNGIADEISFHDYLPLLSWWKRISTHPTRRFRVTDIVRRHCASYLPCLKWAAVPLCDVCARGYPLAHNCRAEIARDARITAGSRWTIRRKKVRERSRGSSPYEGRAKVKSQARQEKNNDREGKKEKERGKGSESELGANDWAIIASPHYHN